MKATLYYTFKGVRKESVFEPPLHKKPIADACKLIDVIAHDKRYTQIQLYVEH